MHAYILVGLDEPNERVVLEEFNSLKEVVEAHILFGEWDIILKIKAESPEEVANFVIEKVRTVEGVSLTSTLVVAE